MLSNYKHIIWDWNGTLLNDVGLCVDIVNNILVKKNLNPLSIIEYKNIFTFPIRNYYERAGFDFSQYTFEEVGLEWMYEYERRRLECMLHSGVTETLMLLKENRIGQSILSAYPHNTLLEIIAHFSLNDFFTHIVGLDNIYATSKVELGKALMKKISNGNGKVLLVGDTEHDCEVAEEIGTDCVLIADGHQSKQKLLACNVPVFDSLLEFSSRLNNSGL
ncbi:MAG: phosphatase [Ignavibacteria bacterium GWA2_35_9]|nr:MAG: phosphatase [Ignavibacteria bacterium GWA2_35_9]OGU44281.1 MAG: phosphatase [Ignavibacteria bacterium GWB2_36_8]OGU50681.1 MAG: phosphatase [Ignavibacteria bacterium GWC2_36_12]